MYSQTGALVRKKFLEHLLPTMLTTVALSMATVLDSIIVGNYLGGQALAVIGITAPVIYCINFLYVLFAAGGMTCASIARGRWELDRANRLFSASIFGGTGVMTVFFIGAMALLTPLSQLVSGGDQQVAALTVEYLEVLLITGPALMLSSGVALFMRADGNPKGAAAVVVVSNVVDLILDYVFVGPMHMGIAGAGLSTSLGYICGIIVVLPYLLGKNGKRNFRFARPTFSDVWEVISTGLPKGLAQIAPLLCALILNTLVLNTFGTLGMSVMTVLINVTTIVNIFVNGTGDTLLPIVGTLYGEGDVKGIRRTVAFVRRILTVACVLLMALFVVFPQGIAVLFGMNLPEERELLRSALWMFAFHVPLYAVNVTLQNFYNTTDRKKIASSIPILSGFAYICAFALVLFKVLPDGLWLCYALSSLSTFVTILTMAVRIRKKETVKGLLLLREGSEDDQVWDLTVDGSKEQSVGLSDRLIAFGKEQGMDPYVTNRIGLAVEEMTQAVVHYAYGDKQGPIDILIRLTRDEVHVRFRDNGKPFDPVDYVPEENDTVVTDGVEAVKRLAKEIKYTRQLGFNMTVLRFARTQHAVAE